MTTSTPVPPSTEIAAAASHPDRATVSRRVVLAAAGLVLAQLGFRGWMTFSSWFTVDDFTFMARLSGAGRLDEAAEPYAGHVMPAGMYLSWLADRLAPYDFRLIAVMLLLMQLLANVGLVMLLVRLFGARPGILPPLAVYLFCSIGTPVAIWWAAGVNAIPMQVALFWGLAAHVEHLRTRSTRQLVLAVVWVLLGLLFFEKTILVLGVYGIVALAYFTTGDLRSRLRQAWTRYRLAAVTYAVLGVAFLAFYYQWALNFSPGQAGNDALGDVVTNMVFKAYLPAVFGGPLEWSRLDQFSLAAPRDAIVIASVALTYLVLRELHRSRSRTLRAWFVPAFFLTCDVVLVLAGRVSFIGSQISLDFRYQGELPAATAIALALATMPVLGARERVQRRGTSVFADDPQRVAAATAAMVLLASVSSVQYVTHWDDTMQARPYFQNLLRSVKSAKEPIPLVDLPVPAFVMWPLGFPDNLVSRQLRHYRDRVAFPQVVNDNLYAVDTHGKVVPVVVEEVRRGLPGPREGCGYAVRQQDVTIPLDGPVLYGGFWVRVGYLSSARTPVVVSAGEAEFSAVLEPGVHALFLKAGTRFDSLKFSGLPPGVTMCTDDVTVGQILPVTEAQEQTP